MEKTKLFSIRFVLSRKSKVPIATSPTPVFTPSFIKPAKILDYYANFRHYSLKKY